MELILAAAVGAVGGWLLSRRERTTSDTAGSVRGRRRPTKRQRAILATLPPDSPSPSIDDLMREEAAALGLDQLTDAGLSLVVRLKVWHRDRPELVDCPHLALRFVIDGDIAPAEATEDDVRLQCASDRQSIAPEPKAAPVVAVLGASDVAPDHPDWVAAERCGRHLATAGLVVTTGGYGGVMEAASKGAAEAGGHVVGVTAPPVFPYRPGANRWVIEERRAATLTERIDALLSTSSAVIVLPGSVGTLTELMVAWNLAQVAALAGEPPLNVVAVGDTWRNLVESLAARMGAGPALVTCVDSVEEAVDVVSTHLRGDG